MKGIGYIRVSTTQQADDGHSLDAQRAKIEAYCDLYEIDLVDTFADEGASGKTLERDGLQAALDAVEDGTADAVVVVKLDRLTRSVADLNVLLERYFAEGKAASLVSVSEQINTDTAAGRLVLNVLMSVSQWEREVISERTSEALQHMKAEGKRTGSIPYGYRLGPDGVHLVEDEAEQEIVDAVVTYREGGLSYRKIAARLADRGFTNRKGRRFNPATIGRILKANTDA
jgi:DNA invertase Pin-like site-specific DNA recombinase